jgi:NitT/TauT family transport system ATP-binding protein
VLLLSRRPARIADFPRVATPRPRGDATLSDAEFVAIKGHCLEVFQREVRKG